MSEGYLFKNQTESLVDRRLMAMYTVAKQSYSSKEYTLDGAIKNAINLSGDFSQQEKKQNYWLLYEKLKQLVVRDLWKSKRKKKHPTTSKEKDGARQALIADASRFQRMEEQRAGNTYEESDIV